MFSTRPELCILGETFSARDSISNRLDFSLIILETKRLLFRTHIKEDRESFVAMHTDSEVRRYVGGQAWSQEKAIQRFRDQYLGNPTEIYGLWATVLKSENK